MSLDFCPKCNQFTLEAGRGFKYQCLNRECCYQGNETGDIEKIPHYSYSDVMVAKIQNKQKEGGNNGKLFD